MITEAMLWIALLGPLQGPALSPQDLARTRLVQLPVLGVEKYVLPNGLTVLLHEDHKTPVVAVNVWYKVGSKDERPGRTGFAHLFEHLMFEGSQHHDREFDAPIERLGAVINGTTDEDRTMYFDTVPSDALELVRWLEADRMGFLLPALTQAELDSQRDIVKNERRQTYDNVPYGQAEEAILRELYPPAHPYHHSVIGSMADLSAARLEDVSAFFRRYYVPSNAILCIAGDFQPAQARRWIEKYFRPLPNGDAVSRQAPDVPRLEQPKHVVQTDQVSLARAQLVWPTVPALHPDEAALDVLSAILGGLSKENRLFRALMYDQRLASAVSAAHPTRALAGTFEVELLAATSEIKVNQLVKIALGEIERLRRDGPTADEVRKAQNQRESELIMGLQSVTRKATVMNQYESTMGDPQGYRRELARIFEVTPEEVRRVAGKYLGNRFLELDVVPGAPAARAPEAAVDRAGEALPRKLAEVAIKDDFDRSVMPALGPAPRFTPPSFTRKRLTNGLEILIAERHELPIVSLELVVKSGETRTPRGKEGLASIAVGLLEEGTKSRDSLQIAGALAEIGARLEAAGGLESSSVGLTTLKRHLRTAADLFADVILRPTFPEKELERLKAQRLAELKARGDDPEATAAELFPSLVFGSVHPYGRPADGTPASVASFTRVDAVAFYRETFVPGNAALVVVGDVEPEFITRELEQRLGCWKPGPLPKPVVPGEPPPSGRQPLYLLDRPAAAQSVLAVGKVGASRTSADYPALSVMNTILGGQFLSRINMNLREDKGFSYGASSHFSFDRGPGPFEAGGTVQTGASREALRELVKELTDIRGSRPASDDEIADARGQIVRRFPGRFETTFGVAGQLATLVAFDLPDDELTTYQSRIERVSKADVHRVAKQYLTPDSFTFLVVGDRSKVEVPLRSLPFVKSIQRIDLRGNPVKSEETAPAK